MIPEQQSTGRNARNGLTTRPFSPLEIVQDKGVVRSIQASAAHFEGIAEWTIHFVDGKPVSAEYRESARKRFAEGERAGELSGKVKLTSVKTWIPEGGQFRVTDKKLAAELDQILKIREDKAEPASGGGVAVRAAPHK